MIDQIQYTERKRNPVTKNVTIIHIFGEELLVEKIGEGCYSSAYRILKGALGGVSVTGLVLIESVCKDISKRTLAKLGPLPYMAKVIELGKEDSNCYYLMPYYRNIKIPDEKGWTKKDEDAAIIVNELRGITGMKQGVADRIRKARVPVKLKQSLLKVLNELYKKDKDAMLDVSKSNVGLDEKGNFVCRDCFASEE